MKMENKVCKNKNCLKPLPDGYKHMVDVFLQQPVVLI